MRLEPIELAACEKVGVGVQRPEDVVVSRDGRVWLSDQASACAEVLADGIPDAELRVIDGAGHLTPSEAPEEFDLLVREFLTR